MGTHSSRSPPEVFRLNALLTQRAEAKRIIAFGQAGADHIRQQRTMKKRWRSPAQSAIEEQLTRGGFQQILSANNLGDAHCGVVNHHRELVSRNFVVTPNNKIAKILSCDELLRAIIAILEGNCIAIRHPEAPIKFRSSLKVGA